MSIPLRLLRPRSIRWIPPGLAALALPLVLLAGCVEAPQQTRSEQTTYSACRRQADRIVERGNVATLGSSQSNPISSPFGATSIVTMSTDHYSVEHERDDVMKNCLHHYDSLAPNQGLVTATPVAAAPSAPVAPSPADLAGPTGSDLTRPPIMSPGQ